MVKKIVKKITGNSSKLNCRGGTSDSRLGAIPRLELGLRNNTIHMVDEKSPVSDLKKLTKIYYNILENYFLNENSYFYIKIFLNHNTGSGHPESVSRVTSIIEALKK